MREIEKFLKTKTEKLLGNKKPKCLNCGNFLREIKDKLVGKKTGHIFKCFCLPTNVEISIG